MKTNMKLALSTLCALSMASLAQADASLVSVIVCDPTGSPCESILVDRAEANLYKTTIQGSIVINSTDVEDEAEAKVAMRQCNQLKRRYDSSPQPGTTYQCRLEPEDAR